MTRPRRDPRAARAAATVATAPRLRIDRAHRDGAPAHSAVASGATAAAPRRISIVDPEFLVFVVAEAPEGVLTRQDRQAIGAARLLDGGAAGAVVLLATGQIADAGTAGADLVMNLPVHGYDPDFAARLIAAAVSRHAPRHVLFAETVDGGDLARRVASLLEEPLFDRVESLSAHVAIRPAAAGGAEWRAAPPRLISIAPDMIAPCRGISRALGRLDAPEVARARSGIVAAEPVAADASDVPLDQAELVLAAGNGVVDFPMFLRLARALGATPGASRVVCDAGRLPRTMQVGASGTVLDAHCYIALGISGAPQHLQGIGAVEHVVAVNTDLHAAIIARAGLAIIADAYLVMRALLARLDAAE
ncbi:MAG TPA: electron transfer flavoprotein subunit alpha/FixB family protein [Acetobacteraceae bacterium]|nr:electron transfer flavoprotein subunit alpha/FixB family protein [Acetobacteraceae bacterium]